MSKARLAIAFLLLSYSFTLARSAKAAIPPCRPAPGSIESLPEWPPIPKDELAMKEEPSNPGASAILLFRDMHTDDVQSFETHYYRIKVLAEEGRKYADVQIPYFEKLFHIQDIRARTVQPDGRTVDFNGQALDQLVVKSKKVKFQAKIFTLPEVRAGSIIEYGYTIRFRRSMPDVLKNPGNYIIAGTDAMMTTSWTLSHELYTRRAHFSLRPLPKATLLWTSNLTSGRQPLKQPDGMVTLEAANIPAFVEEEHMPPEDMEKERCNFYYWIGRLNSVDFWVQRGTSWEEGFEQFIGDSKGIKHAVSEIVAPNDPPDIKLRKLYARAQQIRFLSFEHSRTAKEEKLQNLERNKKAEDVLKHGYASNNEINLLYVAFARAAGFYSSPIPVAPRDHNFFHGNIPDDSQLGAMVVWVKTPDREYYLDPATLYCPFNLLPWNESGTSGMRAGKTDIVWVKTPNPQSRDATTERKAWLRLDREGNLEGKVHLAYTGQEALERRLDNLEADQAGRRKNLEDEVKGWLPAGATVELKSAGGWDQPEEALLAEFTVKISGYATLVGRRLLLPLSVFEANQRNPFQAAKRIHPVYLPYPYQMLDEVNLQLPAGLKIESVPPAEDLSVSFGRYVSSYRGQPGGLQLHRKFVMDVFYFETEVYPQLRSFYERMRADDGNQTVLQIVSTAEATQPR